MTIALLGLKVEIKGLDVVGGTPSEGNSSVLICTVNRLYAMVISTSQFFRESVTLMSQVDYIIVDIYCVSVLIQLVLDLLLA